MVIMVIIKGKMLMLAIDEVDGRMFLTSWYFYANAWGIASLTSWYFYANAWGIASVPFEIMLCINFTF